MANRAYKQLTAKFVESTKKIGNHLDGDGLYLQVTEGARGINKSWLFKYQLNKKVREMGLGSFRDVSLLEARQKSQDARKLLLQGFDPLNEKNAKRSILIPTFAECCDTYITAHQSSWKNPKSEAQWRSTLANDAEKLSHHRVNLITTPMVLQVLKPIWETKSVTAQRLRGRIEKVLDYAKSLGYRDGDNPAEWKGNLEFSLSQKPQTKIHQPSLDWHELTQFIPELRAKDCLSAYALEFLILTATRTSEVINAEWSEIDLKEARWTIPAARMKANKEHVIPLSTLALNILKKVKDLNDQWIFPNDKKPLSNMAMLELVRGMGPYKDKDSKKLIVVHGFRSTFRNWASEATNYPKEIIERALAHGNPDKTEAAYLRSDQYKNRVKLMNAYARLIEGKITNDKIIQFRSAA
jgi:integrase